MNNNWNDNQIGPIEGLFVVGELVGQRHDPYAYLKDVLTHRASQIEEFPPHCLQLSVYNSRALISVGNFDERHIVAFIDRRS